MAKRLLLKVFSGPHVGAEVQLADGEHLLGRGDGCDLVLDDLSVAERHVKLIVAGDKVQCVPLGDAQVFVEGKPTDGCALAPHEYLTLGTTHVAVGPAAGAWPARPLPALPNPAAEAEPPPSEPPAPEPAAAAPAEAPSRPRKRRSWTPVAAVVVAPVLILAVTFWILLRPSAAGTAGNEKRIGSRLAEIFGRHGVGASVKTTTTERGVAVHGHVASRETRKSLEAELRDAMPDGDVRLYDSETLAAAASEVLKAHHLDLTAAAGAPGEVTITGKAPDAAKWAKVKERLRTDLPASVTLVDRVTLPEPKTKAAAKDQSPSAPPLVFQGVSIGETRSARLVDGTRVTIGARVGDGFEVTAITEDAVELRKGTWKVIYKLKSGG